MLRDSQDLRTLANNGEKEKCRNDVSDGKKWFKITFVTTKLIYDKTRISYGISSLDREDGKGSDSSTVLLYGFILLNYTRYSHGIDGKFKGF